MTTLFISDLHLDQNRPDICAQFEAFLQGPATQAEALYILGDLFEAWIGDDDDNPVGQSVACGLVNLAERGIPADALRDGIEVADIDTLTDLLMEDGRKPIWT